MAELCQTAQRWWFLSRGPKPMLKTWGVLQLEVKAKKMQLIYLNKRCLQCCAEKKAPNSQVITEFSTGSLLQKDLCLLGIKRHCLHLPLKSIVWYIIKNTLEENNIVLFYRAKAFSVHFCFDANKASKSHPNQNPFPCCYGMWDKAASQN